MTVTDTRRGTSNANQRGSSYARRARRAWLIENFASNFKGFCRCYRCGVLLFNPDDPIKFSLARETPTGLVIFMDEAGNEITARPVTVDRIIPGCQGGTYRRNNIRPACGRCNSETGGSTRR